MFGKTIDPVCGMKIRKSRAAATSRYGGRAFYFCHRACKEAFDEEPRKYLGKKRKA